MSLRPRVVYGVLICPEILKSSFPHGFLDEATGYLYLGASGIRFKSTRHDTKHDGSYR